MLSIVAAVPLSMVAAVPLSIAAAVQGGVFVELQRKAAARRDGDGCSTECPLCAAGGQESGRPADALALAAGVLEKPQKRPCAALRAAPAPARRSPAARPKLEPAPCNGNPGIRIRTHPGPAAAAAAGSREPSPGGGARIGVLTLDLKDPPSSAKAPRAGVFSFADGGRGIAPGGPARVAARRTHHRAISVSIVRLTMQAPCFVAMEYRSAEFKCCILIRAP